jgi:hypothetical protein
VPCCDLCVPSLLDKTRPGIPRVVTRQTAVKRGQPSGYTRQKLLDWCTSAWKRDFPGALFASSAIMTDETVLFLSSIGRILSKEHLSQVLAGQWKWEKRYGNELHSLLSGHDIPLMKPLPKKTHRTKRSAEDESTRDPGIFSFRPILTPSTGVASPSRGESSLRPQKRSRTDDDDQLPTSDRVHAGAYYVPSMAQHPPYIPN